MIGGGSQHSWFGPIPKLHVLATITSSVAATQCQVGRHRTCPVAELAMWPPQAGFGETAIGEMARFSGPKRPIIGVGAKTGRQMLH